MLQQAVDELTDAECRKILNKMLKDNKSGIRKILSDALSYVDNTRKWDIAGWDISEATPFFE